MSDNDDYNGIMQRHRDASRPKLEQDAASGEQRDVAGSAKAEMLRRDRQYAETIERKRQEFENALGEKQLAAAQKQLDAAVDVAKATKRAFWAAVAAAVGAIVQGGAAVLGLVWRCNS